MRTEVPACLDTLTVHVGIPIPEKHPNSPVEWPMQIYKRVYIDGGLQILPVSLTVRFDYENGDMIALTEGMPAYEGDSSAPLTYILYTDCRYFEGPDGEQPLMQYFSKQSLIHAYSEARTLKDSALITDYVGSEPTRENGLFGLLNGAMISTPFKDSIWTFDHWSSSFPLAALDPFQVLQVVQNKCWPLRDTVVFTAWYNEAPVSVNESSAGLTPDVTFLQRENTVTVVAKNQDMCTVAIIDLHGRVVSTYSSLNTYSSTNTYSTVSADIQHVIDTSGLSGFYLLVGTIGTRPFAQSFVFHR